MILNCEVLFEKVVFDVVWQVDNCWIGLPNRVSYDIDSCLISNRKHNHNHTNSALTGKIDKEKQKRDQDIINAARENNILLNSSRVPHPPIPPNYFSQR